MLGPVPFTLYTTPLSAIISSFDINNHRYADDTQIYMSLSVSKKILASIMTHDHAKDLCAAEDIGAIEVLLIHCLKG